LQLTIVGLALDVERFTPGTDVIILKIFSKKTAQNLAFLTQNKAKLCKNVIITLVFEKNANFVRRKLSKLAENFDHNIDQFVSMQSHKSTYFELADDHFGRVA
jgi:hypothetical protein